MHAWNKCPAPVVPARLPTILATSMGFNRAGEPWRPSPIFGYAFDLAGNPGRPKLCFISTGTGDRQASIDAFYAAFAGTAVDTSHFALFEKPNVADVANICAARTLSGSIAAVW